MYYCHGCSPTLQRKPATAPLSTSYSHLESHGYWDAQYTQKWMGFTISWGIIDWEMTQSGPWDANYYHHPFPPADDEHDMKQALSNPNNPAHNS